MLITNYIIFVNEQKVLQHDLKNYQNRVLTLLSNAIPMPLINNETKIANKIINSIITNPNIVEITIKNSNKIFIHKYFAKRATGKIFTKKKEITFNNKHIGEVTLIVSTNNIEKTIFLYIKKNFQLFLYQLIFTVPLIIILYYYKIAKPVKNLLNLANDIKNENFSQTYKWKYKDELSKIGKSFEETKNTISKLITKDSLTGVNNRFMMDKSLNEIVDKKNQNFSITFFDIDDFKKVNDSYGYETGDKLLKALCLFIAENIDNKDIFGRWSAEEFLIIHQNKQIEEAYAISKNLQESINNTTLIPALHITCSFGVSSYDGNENVESILKRCDKALFISKAQGKNRVITL